MKSMKGMMAGEGGGLPGMGGLGGMPFER
jgi:hypothetical protein